MNIYYIDYENVSSQGLKGVEALTENDEVNLLYSKKADNVKIDMLTMLMASKAKIHFLPVHVGTPNALDFQLVTLLFLNYREEDHCFIISKDSGYDCCIKTAIENGAPNVARFPNIESAINGMSAKKTRKGKRTIKEPEDNKAAEMTSAQAAPSAAVSGNVPGNAPAAAASSVKHDIPASAPVSASAVAVPVASEDTSVPASVSQDSGSHGQEEPAKKKPSRKRGRKKGSALENESEDAGKQSRKDLSGLNPPESGTEPAQGLKAESEKDSQKQPEPGSEKQPGKESGKQPGKESGKQPEKEFGKQPEKESANQQRKVSEIEPAEETDREFSIEPGKDLGKHQGTDSGKRVEKTSGKQSEKDFRNQSENDSGKQLEIVVAQAEENPAHSSDASRNTSQAKSSDSESHPEHVVQEHVLQQRYLSSKFDQRKSAGTASGAKPDGEKPVSILSVVRRRNDVQLDMHQIDLIREALKNSGNKQQFYSYFVKKLGQKQGIELYHSIKSSYTDLMNATLL